MADYSSLRVLRVFLASPGDLTEERRAAKRAVDELNQSLAKEFGWLIDLRLWEDALPGAGRPQELINKDVWNCDLFVGLLWRRWGLPTGSYSSGFEEEFEIARERRSKGGKPDIWLCFKEIESTHIKDPGEQIARVLEFRQKQVAAREFLFKDFQAVDDWERLFRGWLETHLANLVKRMPPQAATPAEAREISSQKSHRLPSGTRRKLRRKGEKLSPGQLARTIETISRAIREGKLDEVGPVGRGMNEFDLARLSLCSETFLSSRLPSTLLENHTLHVLFRHKERLEFTPAERHFVLRTIIGDPSDLAAGWFWFRDEKEAHIASLGPSVFLPAFATTDANEWVRKRAYVLMNAASIYPDADVADTLLRAALSEQDERVRASAMELLSDRGNREAVDEIRKAEMDADARKGLAMVRLSILARSNPAGVLVQLIDASEEAERPVFDYVMSHDKYKVVLRELQRQATAIGSGILRRMLALVDPEVREFAAKEMVKRGEILREQAVSMLEDESPTIRTIALEWLINHTAPYDENQFAKTVKGPDRGEAIQPEESYRLKMEFFRRMPEDALVTRIDWYDADGPLAYLAYGIKNFEKVGEKVRNDLTQGFRGLAAASAEELASASGVAPDKVVERFRKHETFIRARFTAAALGVLATAGEKSDARFARELITRKEVDIQKEAIKILAKWGNRRDADVLVAVARGSTGELKWLAAEAALHLDNHCVDVLMSTNNFDLVSVSLEWLSGRDTPDSEAKLEHLLGHEDARLREKALAAISKRFQPAQMETLLRRYTEKDWYYYNVVCWLDRILYAPAPMQEFFRRELTSKLS